MGAPRCWQELAGLTAAIVLCSAAAAQSPEQDAYRAWGDCFQRTAKRYAATPDPAESAARLIRFTCADFRRRYVELMQAGGKDAIEANRIALAIEAQFIDSAAFAIIETRASK